MTSITFTLAGRQFELSEDDVRERLASHHPDRVTRYWAEIDGARWPVKQVVAYATGLSPIEFQSRDARRVLTKLGFTVGSLAVSLETVRVEPPESERIDASVRVPDVPPVNNIKLATDVSVSELMKSIQDPSRARPISAILAAAGEGLRSAGLYSWWVDEKGASDLSAGLGLAVSPGLIYAGLAGATRKNGTPSSNTLWGRIASMHLGRRHRVSTLRLSLGSTLARAKGWKAIDEEQLTLWMMSHLRVATVPVANADSLDDLESELLKVLDPPLNLMKVAKTPLRKRLAELRKAYGSRSRA